jgi:hypothetical protein
MRAPTSRALPANFLQAYFPSRAKWRPAFRRRLRRAPKLDTRRRSDFAKAPVVLGRLPNVLYGTELPALALTIDVSAALIVPLAFTSVRKFV